MSDTSPGLRVLRSGTLGRDIAAGCASHPSRMLPGAPRPGPSAVLQDQRRLRGRRYSTSCLARHCIASIGVR